MMIYFCLFKEEGEAVPVLLLYLQDKWLEALTHKDPGPRLFSAMVVSKNATNICLNIILATNRDRNPLP